jgi:hypothetical protein
VSEWVAGAGLADAIATFQLMFENIRHGFMKTSNASHIAFAAIGDGFATVGQYIGGIAKTLVGGLVAQFQTAAKTIGAAIEFIKNPSREAFAAIGTAARESAKAVADTYVNTAKAFATNTGIVSRRTEEAIAARGQIEQEHADRVAAIAQAQADRLNAIGKKRVDDAAAQLEQIGIAAANNANAVEDAKQREIDALKEADKVQQEIKDRQDRDRADELKAELDALNKIKAAREETAKKTVGQFIEEAAKDKDEQAAADKDRERGERLRERAAKRGVTLSKKDREFLDAFDAIDAAGKGLKEDDPLMQNIKIAQDNLEQLKLDSKTLADMLDALDKANTIAEDARKEMQQLLRAG